MNVEELAFEVGRKFARLEKKAVSDEYIANASSQHDPIIKRMMEHGLLGAGLGAGLAGAGHLLLRGARTHRGGNLTSAVLNAATKGGTIGLGTGALHGGYDAGLTRGVTNSDDNSTLRSALVSGLVGNGSVARGLMGALAAEVGERHGVSARPRFGG